MVKEELTPLERDVLDLLLAGDDPVLSTLRAQYATSKVSSRDYTGVGFFTDFIVDADAPQLPKSVRLSFGNVEAQISGLAHGAGFVLFVEDGAIQTLEGYCYDEQWPNDIDDYSVSYIGGRRDLNELRQAWSGTSGDSHKPRSKPSRKIPEGD